MTESAGSAGGLIEPVNFLPDGLGNRGDDQLGDTIAPLDGEGFLAEIRHDYPDFTAVIGIDRAG